MYVVRARPGQLVGLKHEAVFSLLCNGVLLILMLKLSRVFEHFQESGPKRAAPCLGVQRNPFAGLEGLPCTLLTTTVKLQERPHRLLASSRLGVVITKHKVIRD